MRQSLLHLLHFPQHGLFTLGIADNSHIELLRLAPVLGAPIADSSYTVEAPPGAAQALMGALRHLLAHAAVDMAADRIDGVYEEEALDTALRYIRIHSVIGHPGLTLTRGLSGGRRLQAALLRRAPNPAERSRQMAQSVSLVAATFARMHRLLLILGRRAHRLPCTLERVECGLRVRLSLPRDARQRLPTAESFRFCVHDQNGVNSFDWVALEHCDEYVEYRVTWPTVALGSPSALLLNYFLGQTRQVLARLPAALAAPPEVKTAARPRPASARKKAVRATRSLNVVVLD